MNTTADTTFNRSHTAGCALQLFDTDLKGAMKYFKKNPNSTAYLNLQKCMIVWQQFDQLQRKACFQEQFNGFLDEAPHVPMGTWGSMVCLLTADMGLTARELSKRI